MSNCTLTIIEDSNLKSKFEYIDVGDTTKAILLKPYRDIDMVFRFELNMSEAKEQLKQELITRIKKINQQHQSSIFIFDSSLNIIYHPAFKDDTIKKETQKSTNNLIKKLLENSENGTFEEFVWQDKLSGNLNKKIYYAQKFEPFDWIIASSIDMNNLKEAINLKKDTLKESTVDHIKATVLIFLAFLALSVVGSFIFSKRLGKIFNEYEDNINKQKEKIIHSNELLKTVIDNTEDLVFYKDKDFKYVLCNQSFCDFLGKSEQEILGKDDFELFDEETSNIFKEEDIYIINNLDSIYVENILTDAKGQRLHFYTHKSILQDKDSTISGIVGFSKNFTETQNLINQLSTTNQALEEKVKARTIELEELNKSLENRVNVEVEKNRQKDKIVQNSARQAQMGEMLSMIAHQWRQPLSIISTIAGSLRLEVELETGSKDKMLDELESIESHTQFLSRTINDFRNFFNPNKLKEDISLNTILEKSISIFAKNFETQNIILEKNYDFKSSVNIYSNEVMQVILNLIKNSIDVFKDRDISSPKITINSIEEKDYQIIEIIDNGGGIEESLIEKVFDPYFSTKNEKNGTGLGLYMSKTIIEDHCKGEITVENYKDGCKFNIKFFITKG
jgi:PAS domain S-box-containing protein